MLQDKIYSVRAYIVDYISVETVRHADHFMIRLVNVWEI